MITCRPSYVRSSVVRLPTPLNDFLPEAPGPIFFKLCSVCACLDLSVSSSSWDLGRAAVCDCGTPWTFLLVFFHVEPSDKGG